MTKPILVVFGPLPPARNGLADYVYGLLPWLSAFYRPVVVIADDSPEPKDPLSETIYESEYRLSNLQSERHLYQLGNNSGLNYVLPFLAATPGIVTIHDMTLHGMLAEATGKEFIDVLRSAHGDLGASIFGITSRYRALNEYCHSSLTLLPSIARRSQAIVAHSQTARTRAIAQGVDCPVFVIPCFCPAPLSSLSKAKKGSRFVEILCLGFVGKSKRIDLVLRALRILVDLGLPVRLTVAGELRPEEYDLIADIQRMDLANCCEVRGYLTEEEMSQALADADILVNLRWPTFGESSGPLLRALWLGTCTVVTDIGSFAEFPNDIVIKIGVEEMSAQAIADRLLPYVMNREKRMAMGARASSYSRAHLSARAAAQQYTELIEEIRGNTNPKPVRKPLELDFSPPGTISIQNTTLREPGRPTAWWRTSSLPLPQPGSGLLMVEGNVEDVARAKQLGWTRVLRWLSPQVVAQDLDAAIVLAIPKSARDCRQMLHMVKACLLPRAFILFDLIGLSVGDRQMLEEVVATCGFEFVDGDEQHRDVFTYDYMEKEEYYSTEFTALAVRVV